VSQREPVGHRRRLHGFEMISPRCANPRITACTSLAAAAGTTNVRVDTVLRKALLCSSFSLPHLFEHTLIRCSSEGVQQRTTLNAQAVAQQSSRSPRDWRLSRTRGTVAECQSSFVCSTILRPHLPSEQLKKYLPALTD
jgi:hypothetical protein